MFVRMALAMFCTAIPWLTMVWLLTLKLLMTVVLLKTCVTRAGAGDRAGHGGLFLHLACALRQLGGHQRLRPLLATDGLYLQFRLAAILRQRALGLHRLRLVLGFHLCVGRDVPLWPVVPQREFGLVLVSRHRLGTVVGDVALLEQLLRLGTAAAGHVHSDGRGHRL